MVWMPYNRHKQYNVVKDVLSAPYGSWRHTSVLASVKYPDRRINVVHVLMVGKPEHLAYTGRTNKPRTFWIWDDSANHWATVLTRLGWEFATMKVTTYDSCPHVIQWRLIVGIRTTSISYISSHLLGVYRLICLSVFSIISLGLFRF